MLLVATDRYFRGKEESSRATLGCLVGAVFGWYCQYAGTGAPGENGLRPLFHVDVIGETFWRKL